MIQDKTIEYIIDNDTITYFLEYSSIFYIEYDENQGEKHEKNLIRIFFKQLITYFISHEYINVFIDYNSNIQKDVKYLFDNVDNCLFCDIDGTSLNICSVFLSNKNYDSIINFDIDCHKSYKNAILIEKDHDCTELSINIKRDSVEDKIILDFLKRINFTIKKSIPNEQEMNFFCKILSKL